MMGRDKKPQFWFGAFGTPPGPIHVAFAASSRAQVREFYKAALAAGGYGAFVIGPDGHNIEAVCHQADA